MNKQKLLTKGAKHKAQLEAKREAKKAKAEQTKAAKAQAEEAKAAERIKAKQIKAKKKPLLRSLFPFLFFNK